MDDTATKTARKQYPSDIKDYQWLEIEKILPKRIELGRPTVINLREVINAMAYMWRTECVWRMLPNDFPNRSTVRKYHDDWHNAGLLDCIQRIIES